MVRKSVLLLLVSAAWLSVRAQDADTTSSSHFSVYGFAGPNFYYNNFQVFKNSVNTTNFQLGGRLMWEPGYRLSFGLNTGYYRLYTANPKGPAASAHFQMTSVPIQLILKMDLYNGIYAFYGMGPSLLYNKITTSNGGEFKSNWLSLADVTMALGYQGKFKGRLRLGGEVLFYHSSKSKENTFTLAFVAGYKLR